MEKILPSCLKISSEPACFEKTQHIPRYKKRVTGLEFSQRARRHRRQRPYRASILVTLMRDPSLLGRRKTINAFVYQLSGLVEVGVECFDQRASSKLAPPLFCLWMGRSNRKVNFSSAKQWRFHHQRVQKIDVIPALLSQSRATHCRICQMFARKSAKNIFSPSNSLAFRV